MVKKTLCKNKPHDWERITRKIDIWPYEVEVRMECKRCGRRKKGGIIV